MRLKHVKLYDPEKELYQLCSIETQHGIIQSLWLENEINEEPSDFDLSAYYAYPAFIEAHCHLLNLGRMLDDRSLEGILNPCELRELILRSNDEIVFFRGWQPHNAPFFLDRSLLDQMDSNRAILIMGKCGHVAYVNTKAIDQFKLWSLNEMDGSSLSSGFLRERALDIARSNIKFTKQQIQRYIETASNHCLSFGITSVHSDDWNVSSSEYLLSALKKQKSIRIYEHLNLSPPFSMDWIVHHQDAFLQNSDFLCISSLKWILDGSLGGRSAYLSQPYHDCAEERGVLYYTIPEITEILSNSEKLGWTSVFHVIGDEALSAALQGFARTIPKDNPLRHRLIHVQIASIKQIEELKDKNVFLSIQPIFYASDQLMAMKRLGAERMDRVAYPFRQMVLQELKLSISTDAPIESINPFQNICIAENFMSRKKAFYAYTVAAAESSFHEFKLGTIKQGKYADLFFLKEELFSIPAGRLAQIRPAKTMFHGTWCK